MDCWFTVEPAVEAHLSISLPPAAVVSQTNDDIQESNTQDNIPEDKTQGNIPEDKTQGNIPEDKTRDILEYNTVDILDYISRDVLENTRDASEDIAAIAYEVLDIDSLEEMMPQDFSGKQAASHVHIHHHHPLYMYFL